MLSSIRKLLDNWLVRAFFIVLVLVFIFWGVSNVVTMIGSNSAVATVAGHPIEASVISRDYQRQVTAYAERHGGHEPSQGIRRLFAGSALGQAIDRATMALEARRLGVTAPPSALRQQIFAMTVFDGPNGKFDKATFNQVLAAHGLTPGLFMADIARSLNASQIVQAITAGVVAPKPMVRQVFDYVGQERTIQYVQLPFAAATTPSQPADSVLRRYWRNHPGRFSTPAMRTIRAVILSPALIAADQPVTKAEIAAEYASEKFKFSTTATRTVEIITAEDATSAASLAGQWKKGADWTTMKQAAAAATATAVTFKDAQPDQFPSGRLAKAVFAAKQGEVAAPVTGALGTYVFKVVKANPGGAAPLSQVAPRIKAQLQLRRARHVVNASVTKLQDALAGDTPLNKLPGDLHLVAVEGTLDAQGMAETGKPAPIPGPAALRKAIIAAAFTAPQGAQPQAKTGPGDSYYAVSVEKIIPPALKPFDTIKSEILADWTGAQVKRQEEVAAAQLLAAVKGGKSFDAAANAAGQPVTTSTPMTRTKPAAGVPAKLLPIIFTLKPGEPTMVETAREFIVGTVTAITEPKPGGDPAIESRIQAALDQAMQTNVLQSYATALRSRYHVGINAKMLHQISD
ncbi:SurA N-terminal domain-containing protein [Acidiphilium sp. AL]|uniref:peptidylprolyl isomerase n=1 Tax=Acidiphilium sp. AL TaxID=2871704 RepID=UPI0021CB42B0|nr:peptidylprolyl isomerase [Acidiphilium sp. AL]MCU4159347.1 SurA N-terminal domain-containing protein [Acidiphilium sp. AL]